MRLNLSRMLFACGLATAALFAFVERVTAEDRTFGNAQWIWNTNNRDKPQVCIAGKTFEITGPIAKATLRAVTDFATAEVVVNDQVVGSLEPFTYAQEFDIAEKLKPGENRLQLATQGASGPAALALRLDITLVDGTVQTIVTDTTWQGRAGDVDHPSFLRFGPVAADRWTDLSPDIAISPFDNYEQWQQAKGTEQTQATDAAKFQIADGFEIELMKSAGPDEGSWVSIACDPQGRFVIGREDQGLLRVTLPGPKNDRSAIQVETINDTLKECRGLLFAHDSLYAVANESQTVNRLRDRNGDGKFELVEELFKFPGKPGHGRNGIALAPDGRLHLICGDSTEIPTGVKDRTSPFTERRRGETTKEGFVFAFDADGKNPEILCTGMRNPYGIAFNEHGDSFTYDADPEFDMGSPWYKSTRVLQLSPGSDFGWRGLTNKWPPYFPDHADNAPLTLDIGKGSPTAVLFGTQSNFPPRYRRALYIMDWAYGRIVAIDLEPRGAGYSGKATTFCKGRPFNVTSMCFGPDGAMYVVTGGRKTQAGLYRIRYTGKPQAEPEPTSQQVARREQAAEQRHYRRKLEAQLSNDARVEFTDIQPALSSADPKLRFVARTIIEHQPYQRWHRLRGPVHSHELKPGEFVHLPNLWESISWLTARSRAALAGRNPDERHPSLTLGPTYFQGEPLTPLQRTALYDLLRSEIETNELNAADRTHYAVVLQAELSRDSSSVPAPLVRALAALRAETLVDAGLKLLDAATTQRDQMLYLYALRDLPGRWSAETRARYFEHLAAARHWQGGEGMPRFIQRITDEALASIPEAERAKYAAMVTPEAQADDDSPLVQTRPVVKAWKADDVPAILSAASDAKPDLARGKQMFAAALCIRCHRFGTAGHAVGPDLTGLARRFSRRDMLEHVIVPSKVIAEQYRTVLIETTDGRVVSGRILSEGDFRLQSLRIATNPLDPRQVTEVAKSDIESHTTTNTSLMPEGLLNTLNEAEIGDLLAFLETAAVSP